LLNIAVNQLLCSIEAIKISKPCYNTNVPKNFERQVVKIMIKLIAIAASTGGVEALEQITAALPVNIPPTLFLIHMPAPLTNVFALRLNMMFSGTVAEAKTGDVLQSGNILVAPGGKHTQLVNNLGKLSVNCFAGERVNFVIPSADVLFESIATVYPNNTLGVILTGIGNDGAAGLKLMRDKGARTIGQDEASSIVYGMPKVAYNQGAVEFQLPLDLIARKIVEICRIF